MSDVSWQVTGSSVRGASHVRAGRPNEDSIGWAPPSGVGTRVVLAVSDGHGSAKCFRSKQGADFAITVAKEACNALLDEAQDPLPLSFVKRWATEQLPVELVRRWRELVTADCTNSPFSEEELSEAESRAGVAKVREVVIGDPVIAYGATLLIVAITETFLLYVQIGDGDIFTVSESGEVSRPELRDVRLIANETTSLCGENAWRDFRVDFRPISQAAPTVILASTDGYANSFINEEAFLKVGTDVLEIIRREGMKGVTDNVQGWLHEASLKGAGDDISLGVVSRLTSEGLSPTESTLKASAKSRQPRRRWGLGILLFSFAASLAFGLLRRAGVRSTRSRGPEHQTISRGAPNGSDVSALLQDGVSLHDVKPSSRVANGHAVSSQAANRTTVGSSYDHGNPRDHGQRTTTDQPPTAK